MQPVFCDLQEWARDSQMKPKAAATQAAVRFALKILRIKTVYRQPVQGTIWIIRQWRRASKLLVCRLSTDRFFSRTCRTWQSSPKRAVSCCTTPSAVLHQIRRMWHSCWQISYLCEQRSAGRAIKIRIFERLLEVPVRMDFDGLARNLAPVSTNMSTSKLFLRFLRFCF